MALSARQWFAAAVFSAYLCVYFETFTFRKFTESDFKKYRDKTARMFRHAYEGYLANAFPFDELKPLSCHGIDTWGSFSLTLIDALDTLAVMKNNTEFVRVVNQLVSTADFNININVSVFETNIRVVGGLISAHLLAQKAGMQVEPGWPCSGPLLQLAEAVARRLLPAFYTKTGMPYGTVNLRYGVPPGETPITCTAGVATFILEFGTLSRLTGDPVFERVALRALHALWEQRSSVGLVGNHINVEDGKWTAMDAGIGGGVDSYYEYLVKGSILFQEPKLMAMFNEHKNVISKYMQRDDWYFWVSMGSGQVTMPVFQSLESFWPGLLTLTGEIEQASKTLYNYHQIWKQYGFTPEFYDIQHSYVKREGYPLRPELIESVMYLYQATKDPYLLEIGADILESIEHSTKTECGYATVRSVMDHRIEDRMESFFLAETTKYLYLLFDPDNFIHKSGSCGKVITSTGGDCMMGTGGYVFNTEAHPIDVSAVYCCSAERKLHETSLQNFQDTMDLHSILNINERQISLPGFENADKKSDFGCDDVLSIYERITEDQKKEISMALEYFPLHRSWKTNSLSSVEQISKIHRSENRESVSGISSSSFVKHHGKGSVESINISTAENISVNATLHFENPDSALELNGNSQWTILENSNTKQFPSLSAAKANLDKDTVIHSTSELTENSLEPKSKNVHLSQQFPSVAADGDLPVSENTPFSTFSGSALKASHKSGAISIVRSEDEIVESTLTENEDNTSLTEVSSQGGKQSVSRSRFGSAPLVPTIPLVNCFDVELSVFTPEAFKEDIKNYDVLFCPAQPFLARLSLMGETFNFDF